MRKAAPADVLATRRFDDALERLGQAEMLRLDQADAFVLTDVFLHDVHRRVRRAVVPDDRLGIPVRLSQRFLDRGAHRSLAVVDGDDDRDELGHVASARVVRARHPGRAR